MILIIILAIIATLVISIWAFTTFAPQFGSAAKGNRLTRIQNSPNYKNGKFQNKEETPVNDPNSSMFSIVRKFLKKHPGREPESTLPFNKVIPGDIGSRSRNEAKITWLGHSSLLIEIEGKVFLTDPVFSKKASPMMIMGPKTFFTDHPISLDSLPQLDAVILSHDHYDHLDYKAILKLKSKTKLFYAPLGVGPHLEKWGVKREAIIEMDWWENDQSISGLEFISTPARHFSGRGMNNRFSTLWCSWVIKSESHTLFFGGDSGYGKHFVEIGKKYGPFDLTMLECGAYNKAWPLIHSMPEETAQAHVDLRGEVLLPIHWAKFNLAMHPWKEPIERLSKKAKELEVVLTTPQIGEPIVLGQEIPNKQWWEEVIPKTYQNAFGIK